jgi:hypothetical protein
MTASTSRPVRSDAQAGTASGNAARMASEFSVLDLETGQFLEGEPDGALVALGIGEAWQPANDPGVWHLRSDRDPRGARYRLVRVLGREATRSGTRTRSRQNARRRRTRRPKCLRTSGGSVRRSKLPADSPRQWGSSRRRSVAAPMRHESGDPPGSGGSPLRGGGFTWRLGRAGGSPS